MFGTNLKFISCFGKEERGEEEFDCPTDLNHGASMWTMTMSMLLGMGTIVYQYSTHLEHLSPHLVGGQWRKTEIPTWDHY